MKIFGTTIDIEGMPKLIDLLESGLFKGDKGDTGPQGPIGPQGPQGDTGPQGPVGDPGMDGVYGQPGPQGDRGPAGMIGATGTTGPSGPSGPQGPQGAIGPAGATGRGMLSLTGLRVETPSSITDGVWSWSFPAVTKADPNAVLELEASFSLELSGSLPLMVALASINLWNGTVFDSRSFRFADDAGLSRSRAPTFAGSIRRLLMPGEAVSGVWTPQFTLRGFDSAVTATISRLVLTSRQWVPYNPS